MDGLDQIREKVLSDYRAKAEEIRARAEAMAQQLRQEAAARSEASEARFQEELVQGQAQADRRLQSELNMERRRVELQAKNALMEEVKGETKKALLALPTEKKQAFYLQLLEAQALEGDELVLAPADQALAPVLVAACSKSIKASAEAGHFDGGILLKRERVTLSLTFDEIIDSELQANQTEIANRLYR